MLQVAKMLSLESLQGQIENSYLQCRCLAVKVGNTQLETLNIAYNHGLFEFLHKHFIRQKKVLKDFGLIKSQNFKAMNREMRYELLKNSINEKLLLVEKGFQGVKSRHRIYDQEIMELEFIFNFFNLMIYENRTGDIAAKKSLFDTVSINQLEKESINPKSISYPEASEDCVTLVVEGKQIHVNSFLLTNNSPVFEAMLNSTFKEGRNRKIELPGKKFNEIIYFLQFLHSPYISLKSAGMPC